MTNNIIGNLNEEMQEYYYSTLNKIAKEFGYNNNNDNSDEDEK